MKRILMACLFVLGLCLAQTEVSWACGGLFCQNSPVDQNAERIIFTDNGDGTISALVQIQYTGFDQDFSWILPLPEPIAAEDVAVPEGAMDAFTELEIATDPVIIPPNYTPFCYDTSDSQVVQVEVTRVTLETVIVNAHGEVGPYGFDVITSDSSDALVDWLQGHNYRVTPEMIPLIDVYVQEKASFLAMRLLPRQVTQDIQPVLITYHTEKPMIPLRLTAVAANPNMAVMVWFFGDSQFAPINYAHAQMVDTDLTFTRFGGNDYRQLLGQIVDKTNGQAFITEYAAPTLKSSFANPLLRDLAQKHQYLTRLNTVISPEEMTVDPVFETDPSLADVSNVHDLSNRVGLYDCERDHPLLVRLLQGSLPGGATSSYGSGFLTGMACVAGIFLVLAIGYWVGRRSTKNS